MEKKPQEAIQKNDNCPCPFGTPFNRVIVCSAPTEETGAREDWYTEDFAGHVVTRQFCALRCRKTDVPKPFII